MSKRAKVIILAEDQRQATLARAYLKRRNFGVHDIYVEPMSSGRGSGEQWVRERYAKAVGAFRWRSTRAATALVVMIDADNETVERRSQQLREALETAHMDQRADAEKIAHLIPKRAVETWILCLNGTAVDEVTDYKARRGIDQGIRPAADVFFDWTRANAVVPGHCVPSLRSAIPEARRIEEG